MIFPGASQIMHNDTSRILIVEDQVVLAKEISHRLRRANYHVVGTARSGREAVEKALHPGADLILMDIVLDGPMDGIDAAREIRSQSDAAIVFLTAHDETLYFERAKATEPYAFLSKPVSPVDLLRTVEMALYKHSMEKKVRESRQQLELVLEATDLSFWDWRIESDYVHTNRTATRKLGYSDEELPPSFSSLLHIVHPDDRSAYVAQVEAHFRGESDSVDTEFRLISRSGEWHWFRSRGRVVERSPDGTPLRMVGTMQDVTAHKNAARARRETETRFRTLVQTANEGIWSVDADGKIDFVNPQAAQMLGLHAQEVVGRHFGELVDEGFVEEVGRQWTRLQAGHRCRFDCKARPQDGSDVWGIVSASPLFDEYGVFVGGFGTVTDITRRKKAEAAVRESEEKYRSLYRMMRLMCDNTPDMIWAKDNEKRFLFANRAICRNLLHARDIDEPIGRTDMFFADRERADRPEDRAWHTFGEICEDSDETVMSTKESGRFQEFGNVRGRFLFLDVFKSPLWDEHGDMIGTVGCARDVTEDRRMEEAAINARAAVVAHRNLLQAALDVLSAHLVILDQSGQIVAANSSWQEFAREHRLIPAEKAVDVNYLDLCENAPEDARHWAKDVAGVLRKVLHGDLDRFCQEYPCSPCGPGNRLRVSVTRCVHEGNAEVVVSHESVPERTCSSTEITG
jgi:PAS domain S-box-containing protein